MKPTRAVVVVLGVVATGRALAQVPPTDAAALRAWLDAGSYREWRKESAPHRSAGPHPDAVVTYLNPALYDSLAAGARDHPAGSAAVKELYRDGKPAGFAVTVKTQPRSAIGRGWYWYEVMSLDADAKPVAAANGAALCFGCHLSGSDYVMTPFPLR